MTQHRDEIRMLIRLLRALAIPGAEGRLAEGTVMMTRPLRGVRVSGPRIPQPVCADAVSLGLAFWEAGRLAITEAGRARLARESGAADTAFLAQHRPLSRRLVDGTTGLVDEAESPLGWLARRRGRDGRPLIDATELQAGERLRADLTRAGMLPRVTSDWSRVLAPGQGGRAALSYPQAVIAARQRVRRALDAVGPDFSGVLVDICGFLKGLEAIESERRWPARSAKIVVGLALRQLARHYGLACAATGPLRARGQHWGDVDFRPAIGMPVAESDHAGRSAARASLRIRSTMERRPFERWGVRCESRPSFVNRSAASVVTISGAGRPE